VGSEVTSKQEHACACGYRKQERYSVYVSSFLQATRPSNESAVQQEWSNCIVSSIRLSGRFDWRNFVLVLAARISTGELFLQLLAYHTVWCTKGGTGSGVDSGRILFFSFGPGSGPGVKNLWKTEPGSGVTLQFRQ